MELKERYFCVFESNVGKVGMLCPDALGDVVRFYVLAKGLLEDAANPALIAGAPEETAMVLEHEISVLDELVATGKSAIHKLG